MTGLKQLRIYSQVPIILVILETQARGKDHTSPGGQYSQPEQYSKPEQYSQLPQIVSVSYTVSSTIEQSASLPPLRAFT